jgi:hypothetical protein
MAWRRRDVRHHRLITADPAGLWWWQRAARRLHLRRARRGAHTTGTRTRPVSPGTGMTIIAATATQRARPCCLSRSGRPPRQA